MEMSASFGEWVRRRRKALDLTQDVVAAHVGCSVGLIRKIESDERRPSRQIADLLAAVLQVPTAERAKFIQVARTHLRTEQIETLQPPPDRLPAPVAVNDTMPMGHLSVVAPQSHLPLPSTPLIGRSAELAELNRLLANPECRLLTIVGPGGMGKTRLALALAQMFTGVGQQMSHGARYTVQFADGVAFVALAALAAPEFIAPAIANALGLALSGRTEPKMQLFNHLQGKQMLLVLDNIEHLLDGVDLLMELLAYSSGLKLLVTSRERLSLQSEWVFDLQGLPIPPTQTIRGEVSGEINAESSNQVTEEIKQFSAVALFVESAQRVHTSFTLSAANQAAIVRICQLLEGLPLGIELAAAWAHLLSCQEIAQEIERNLDFLTTTRRGMFARHRSLRAVFDHSWQLLRIEERHALQRLTVFQGGFTRDLAKQVADVSLSTLLSLITKSLLRRTAEARYDLHDLVRQFAAEYLHQAREAEEIRRAHAATFLALAEATDLRRVHGPLAEAAMQRLRAERDNLRAALTWSTHQKQEGEMGIRLAAALGQFWSNEGDYREGRQWLEAALALPTSPETTQARARVLTSLGMMLEGLGEFARSLHCYAESLTLSRTVGDEWTIAWTQYQHAHVLVYQQDLAGAQAVVEESRQRFCTLGDAWGVALSHWMMADIAGEQGRHQEAIPWLEENLTLFKTIQAEGSLAVTYLHLGNAMMYVGEFAPAAQALQMGLTLCQKLRRKAGIRWALASLGILMQMQGEALQAHAYFADSLKLGVESSDKLATVDVIGELACVAQMLHEAPRAAQLFAVESVFRKALGAPVPREKQAKHDHFLTAARTQLGESAFALAWTEGQALNLEQAVALALAK